MKITICGSLTFTKEMSQIKKNLENFGHKVLLPESSEEGKGKEYFMNLKEKNVKEFIKIKGQKIKLHLSKIEESDAILVLNYKKNGKPNYIGANTFLEMGFAFSKNKKIFTLFPIPENEQHDELLGMNTININENISKILD